MDIDYQKLRLDGIYQQSLAGDLMLRVKIPAGVLSSDQAEKICTVSEQFSNALLHLTSRGSIEFHWLQFADLPQIVAMLSAVGLTSRGACGGAVRGVSCSSSFSADFGIVQALARKLHRHFAGNPHFEGLPKKFKIGVDAGYDDARHLIQDIGLVYTETVDSVHLYDVWCAGGLGREPQAAILYEQAVPEHELISLIEAVVRVYAQNTPPPKRLKFLLNQIGEAPLREKIEAGRRHGTEMEPRETLDGPLTLPGDDPVEIPVFAGELKMSNLLLLAGLAREHGNGFLALSADQNILLPLQKESDRPLLQQRLKSAGLLNDLAENRIRFRVCPGNHECRMGLSPTRDVARQICQALGDKQPTGTLAISGCSNGCSQPQLAALGIITRKSVKQEDGTRTPLFDLLRRSGAGFGEIIQENLDLSGLLAAIAQESQ
jgi:sulfite reductase beta subunit-like hemoprotein